MYSKLHSSIIHSTIWREPDHVRLVWITMLALSDQHGEVQASLPGLADAARVDIPEAQDALDALQRPDPFSRTKDHEGRRIEPIEGGWLLLNYQIYRERGSIESRREKDRLRQQRFRERQAEMSRENVTECDMSRLSRQAEAEAEADSKAKTEQKSRQQSDSLPAQTKDKGASKSRSATGSRLPDDWECPEEWLQWAGNERRDLDPIKEADKFRDYFIAQPGAKGRKANWKATWRNWIRNAHAPRQAPVRDEYGQPLTIDERMRREKAKRAAQEARTIDQFSPRLIGVGNANQ